VTLTRKWLPSPCYSSRGGTRATVIVLHTAEGATTIESLGSWFANPANGVSSHTGADDKPGTVGEYVRRDQKAWTQGNANAWCVSLELCGFAKWTLDEWHRHPNMLANCAAWIAEEAAAFGIPIARSPNPQAGAPGVCQHVDLGDMGGNHWDCGGGFPLDEVLEMAGGAAPSVPPPATGTVPPWPGVYLMNYCEGHGTAQWQAQMQARGWTITVDDCYGPQSEEICFQFQRDKHLDEDGIVGPQTWEAAWTAPIT
jgi:hypothetical protein